MLTTDITRDTTLCISLSGRPSNLGHAIPQLPLRRARAELRLQGVHDRPTSRRPSAASGPSGSGARASRCRSRRPSSRWSTPWTTRPRSIESVNTIVNNDGHLRGVQHRLLAVATLLRRARSRRRDGRGARQRRDGEARASPPCATAATPTGRVVARNEADRPSAGRGVRVRLGARGRRRRRRSCSSTPRRSAWPADRRPTRCPCRPRSSEAAEVVLEVVAMPPTTPLSGWRRSAGADGRSPAPRCRRSRRPTSSRSTPACARRPTRSRGRAPSRGPEPGEHARRGTAATRRRGVRRFARLSRPAPDAPRRRARSEVRAGLVTARWLGCGGADRPRAARRGRERGCVTRGCAVAAGRRRAAAGARHRRDRVRSSAARVS